MKNKIIVLLLFLAVALSAAPVTCPNCKGTGYEPGESKKMSNSLSSSRTPCSMCKGKKKVEPKISKVMGLEIGTPFPGFQKTQNYERDGESGLYLCPFSPRDVMKNSTGHAAMVTPSGVIAGITFNANKVPGFGYDDLVKTLEKTYGRYFDLAYKAKTRNGIAAERADTIYKFALKFSECFFIDEPFSRAIVLNDRDAEVKVTYLDKSLYEAGAKEAAAQAGVSAKGL